MIPSDPKGLPDHKGPPDPKVPPVKVSHVETARTHWRDGLPDWVLVMAEHCDQIGQPAVAQRIGMSTSVVSDTLRSKYKGRLDRVQERVKGALMGETVSCPVLGDDLPRDRCLHLQGRPFAATNPERVQLYRTCPACPHFRGVRKAAASVPASQE